jgi:hypothetical protein
MWGLLKALPLASKLTLAGAILAALLLTIGSTYYVAYNKGLNVSALAIERYQTSSAKLMAAITKSQGIVRERRLVSYVDRVKVIDNTIVQTRTIVRDSVPQQFKFSRGWIYSYNQSVKNLPVDPVLASDATPATVSDVDALADTIVPNNGRCLVNKARLDELQAFVRESDEVRKQAVNSQ